MFLNPTSLFKSEKSEFGCTRNSRVLSKRVVNVGNTTTCLRRYHVIGRVIRLKTLLLKHRLLCETLLHFRLARRTRSKLLDASLKRPVHLALFRNV